MRPRIFISCLASEDGISAQLTEMLESRGCTVWRHQERARSAAYRFETARAIDAAQVMVVLWSSASVASAWIIDEADAGMKKGAAIFVELGQTVGSMGFAGAARVSVPKSRLQLSEQDETNIWEAILDLVEPANLQAQQAQRRIWLDRSPQSALANMCVNLALFGAVTFAANVAQEPRFLTGTRGMSTCLIAAISSAVFGYVGDALAQRLGTLARAYRRRLAFRWLAEGAGAGSSVFLHYLLLNLENPNRDPTWLSNWPVLLCALSLSSALLLTAKFAPLLISKRLQRFLLGRPEWAPS